MENILKIANEHNLHIVEDVAHAPGAACEVQTVLHSTSNPDAIFKRCGSIGDIGCFSFFSNKNMTTAEGGMLTTDSDILAERIRILRSHGMTSLTWDREQGHSFSYDVVDFGFNYRIDEIRSAIGLKQLEKLDINNKKRLSIREMYINLLKSTNEISIPFMKYEVAFSPHIFPIILNQSNRHEFMEFLKVKGIQTSIHYPLIHKFSAYLHNYKDVKLEICESIEDKMVTLPLFSSMSDDDVYYIVDAIKSWFAKNHD
jgi:dTDP-4-amino-4,6-dideoxygalactose transaminase